MKAISRISSIPLLLMGISLIAILSFSSCSEDEMDLQTCEMYEDSINLVFARNYFLGSYESADACNIAPVNIDYVLSISEDPENQLGLIVNNAGGLSVNGGLLEGLTIKANIVGYDTSSSHPKEINIPSQTFTTNNSETIVLSGEGWLIVDALSMQYKLRIGTEPERSCIINGVKLSQ